jgi:symplekin
MDPNIALQISNLNEARKLGLGDPTLYEQIVPSILPIVGRDAIVEIKRWGADFLAETFASPAIHPAQKETLCLIVLDTLKTLIEVEGQDAAVVKSCVQAAASCYPLVVRWMYVLPIPI